MDLAHTMNSPRIGPLGSVPDGTTLDAGIAEAVAILQAGGIETFECAKEDRHAFYEPTVRFHGYHDAGWRALAVALSAWLRVSDLGQYSTVIDGEPSWPDGEIVFSLCGPERP
jgi:hypothetical protein